MGRLPEQEAMGHLARVTGIVIGALLAAHVAAATALIGAPAPDFALPSLSGPNLRLSEYRSEIVVLNFWSAGCRKCERAMPLFASIERRFADQGVNVLAVQIDGDEQAAQALVAEYSLVFPVMLDRSYEATRAFDVGRLPYTVVIDREGNVWFEEKGFDDEATARILAAVNDLVDGQ